MHKLLLSTVVTGVMLLTGCSGEPKSQEIKPESVISAFKNAGIPIANEVIYTAETDKNNLLGRPNQYIAKANWADTRLQQSESDLKGGTVEIFKSNDDLKARKDYVDKIGQNMPMMLQYQYQEGLVLIRLDKELTPEQAMDYEKALNKLNK